MEKYAQAADLAFDGFIDMLLGVDVTLDSDWKQKKIKIKHVLV